MPVIKAASSLQIKAAKAAISSGLPILPMGWLFDNFSKISVFDRYGKLLKNMTINSNFWDGTYNGVLMPTNDYWFEVDYFSEDGTPRVFRSHFTLKR